MLMFRKLWPVLFFIFCAFCSSSAQDSLHRITTDPIWDSIKAEMTRCVVCKNIVAEWFKYKPKMKEEAIRLGSGVVFLQTFYGSYRSIDARIFRDHTRERNRIFRATVSLSDEQVKDSLCSFCRELRNLVLSGALIDWGDKEDGIITVITSADTSVRSKIFNLLSIFPERFGIERIGFNPGIIEWPTLDSEPVLLKKIEAIYPKEASERKLEGQVVVAILIDSLGIVDTVVVIKSTNKIFNDAAVKAAKQWIFKPAIYQGKPVKFWYNAPIDFKIK